MILEEAHEPRGRRLVGDEELTDPGRRVGGVQCVEQPLVVGEREALVEQDTLEIPVDLRDVNQLWRAPRGGGPEFVGQAGPLTVQPGSPGALEHVIQHQHRHVAAHAVAMCCHLAQLAPHRVARLGIEVVQLRDVAPRRKIRIPAARDVHAALHAVDGAKVLGRGAHVLLGSEHIPLRVLANPRMIESGVIRYEIEDQPDAPGP